MSAKSTTAGDEPSTAAIDPSSGRCAVRERMTTAHAERSAAAEGGRDRIPAD
jgi:hypothetical protein